MTQEEKKHFMLFVIAVGLGGVILGFLISEEMRNTPEQVGQILLADAYAELGRSQLYLHEVGRWDKVNGDHHPNSYNNAAIAHNFVVDFLAVGLENGWTEEEEEKFTTYRKNSIEKNNDYYAEVTGRKVAAGAIGDLPGAMGGVIEKKLEIEDRKTERITQRVSGFRVLGWSEL